MSKKEKEEGKTVFTIIDIEHNTKEQKQNTINYSINLAKVTARDLVFYFLGKIKEDQVIDYAKRRNVSTDVAMKWLNPNIAD